MSLLAPAPPFPILWQREGKNDHTLAGVKQDHQTAASSPERAGHPLHLHLQHQWQQAPWAPPERRRQAIFDRLASRVASVLELTASSQSLPSRGVLPFVHLYLSAARGAHGQPGTKPGTKKWQDPEEAREWSKEGRRTPAGNKHEIQPSALLAAFCRRWSSALSLSTKWVRDSEWPEPKGTAGRLVLPQVPCGDQGQTLQLFASSASNSGPWGNGAHFICPSPLWEKSGLFPVRDPNFPFQRRVSELWGFFFQITVFPGYMSIIQKDTCTPMFTAALFTIART